MAMLYLLGFGWGERYKIEIEYVSLPGNGGSLVIAGG
jgi:hypothetical protein